MSAIHCSVSKDCPPEYVTHIKSPNCSNLLNEYVCGFVYFKDIYELSIISKNLKEFLLYREQDLFIKFGNTFKGTFMSEMSLMYYITDINKLNVDILPSYPELNNFNDLIFDPATYGQTLGGISPYCGGTGDRFVDINHILGKYIANGEIEVYIDNKKPFVKNLKTNVEYRLFNLHVHGKNLNKFKSY